MLKDPRMLFVALALAFAAGCESIGRTGQTEEEAKAATDGSAVAVVQSEVMSYTDTFISAIAQEWNRVASDARSASDPSGLASFTAEQDLPSRQRRAALANKLANASAALAIASSPNPYVAVADLVTMVTLQRMVLEGPQAAELYGPERTATLVACYREQEARAWRMAQGTMPAQQQQDLAALIAEWREQHPNDTYVSNVRLEDFSATRQQTIVTRSSSRGNLLSLIWLDPLAGLDPAEREVQKTRLLGERMFYYASRSPQILKWHVESLYQDLLRAPEFKQTLASVERANDAAARISTVAEQLPADVAAERRAALNQFFEQLALERRATVTDIDQAVAAQREAIVKQLDDAQGTMQSTLREFRTAADTADRMAASVTTAINAADSFAARFDDGEPGPGRPDDKPDALVEFRETALKTADAADRLTTLTRSIDELLNSPGISTHADTIHGVVLDVNANVKQVISFAFWRLLALVLVTPLSIAFAALLYKRMLRS